MAADVVAVPADRTAGWGGIVNLLLTGNLKIKGKILKIVPKLEPCLNSCHRITESEKSNLQFQILFTIRRTSITSPGKISGHPSFLQ